MILQAEPVVTRVESTTLTDNVLHHIAMGQPDDAGDSDKLASTPHDQVTTNIVVGIDLSLSSPALCAMVLPSAKTVGLPMWHLAGFCKRKREAKLVGNKQSLVCSPKGKVTLELLPAIPSGDANNGESDMVRYIHIVEHIQTFVAGLIENYPGAAVKCVLEAYAFPRPKTAGSSYKLRELGGILKFVLGEMANVSIDTIAISRWRKHALDRGNADKLQTYKEFTRSLLNGFDVCTHIGVSSTKVPAPVNDVFDAIGVAIGYYSFTHKLQTKMKKSIKKKKMMKTIKTKHNGPIASSFKRRKIC